MPKNTSRAYSSIRSLEPLVDFENRFGQVLWSVWALLRIRFSRPKADVIHFQGLYFPNALLLLLLPLKRLGNPSVFILPVLEKGDLHSSNTKSSLKSFILRKALKKVDLVLCLSAGIQHEAKCLREDIKVARIFSPARLLVSQVDLDSRLRQIDPLVIRIGFVGKVQAKKRPDLIIRALAALNQRGLRGNAVFIGPFDSNAYESHLRDLTRELGLEEQVDFFGFSDTPENDLVDKADFLVLISKAEGQPGALVEALALGLPSIVSDVGSMGEIIRASGGGFVVEEALDELVDAIILMNSNKYEDMANAARTYALENFSMNATAQRYKSLIEDTQTSS